MHAKMSSGIDIIAERKAEKAGREEAYEVIGISDSVG